MVILDPDSLGGSSDRAKKATIHLSNGLPCKGTAAKAIPVSTNSPPTIYENVLGSGEK